MLEIPLSSIISKYANLKSFNRSTRLLLDYLSQIGFTDDSPTLDEELNVFSRKRKQDWFTNGVYIGFSIGNNAKQKDYKCIIGKPNDKSPTLVMLELKPPSEFQVDTILGRAGGKCAQNGVLGANTGKHPHKHSKCPNNAKNDEFLSEISGDYSPQIDWDTIAAAELVKQPDSNDDIKKYPKIVDSENNLILTEPAKYDRLAMKYLPYGETQADEYVLGRNTSVNSHFQIQFMGKFANAYYNKIPSTYEDTLTSQLIITIRIKPEEICAVTGDKIGNYNVNGKLNMISLFFGSLSEMDPENTRVVNGKVVSRLDLTDCVEFAKFEFDDVDVSEIPNAGIEIQFKIPLNPDL